jgi:hypothetical protein
MARMILIAAFLSITTVMSYGQSKGTRKPSMKERLQGQWQSTEDPKSLLLLEKGVLKSRYGSKGAWASEAIVVSDRCMNEGDKDWLPGVGWKTFNPHQQTPKWYEAKIVQGKASHAKKLERKSAENQKLSGELDIIKRELDESEAILRNLDKILNPGGTSALEAARNQVEVNKANIEAAIEVAETVPQMQSEAFDFPDSEVKV